MTATLGRGRWYAGRLSAVVAGLVMVVAACSSGGSDSATPSTTGQTGTAAVAWPGPADWQPAACDREVTGTPEVEPVAGSDSDFDLTSFDGTTIRIHWFPVEGADGETAPTVLMGPGWGTPGDTNVDPDAEPGLQSLTSIGGLHGAGYNVLTWDPRGFGESTGTVQIDSADFEARDVSMAIDWIASRDGVTLDSKGDPRIGMVGLSYGGGIQFVTAATDCRVDVISPMMAWNSLTTSLYPAETFKAGWVGLLVDIASTADLNDHILSANEAGSHDEDISQGDREWMLDRGPDDLVAAIGVPTLIVQGTVDNLFPLSEGIRNYVSLAGNDIPLAMMWFCGGHGVCGNPPEPDSYESDPVYAWLARYLKDDTDGVVVPGFQTTDQLGDVHSFPGFPPPGADRPVFAFADSGSLELQPEGGSGPYEHDSDGGAIATVAVPVTPDRASRALEVPVTVSDEHALVLGAPDLALGYSCALEGDATRPTRIFAQIVDDATGRVLGNQVTPVPITCDGSLHMAQVELEPIVYAPSEDGKLTLQLVATTVAYAVPQMGGNVDFARIELILPTVSG